MVYQYPSSLTLRLDNCSAYSKTAHRFPRRVTFWLPTMITYFIKTPLFPTFLFLSHFPTPLTFWVFVLSRITFQVNYLHSHLCLRVCFWGDPNSCFKWQEIIMCMTGKISDIEITQMGTWPSPGGQRWCRDWVKVWRASRNRSRRDRLRLEGILVRGISMAKTWRQEQVWCIKKNGRDSVRLRHGPGMVQRWGMKLEKEEMNRSWRTLFTRLRSMGKCAYFQQEFLTLTFPSFARI